MNWKIFAKKVVFPMGIIISLVAVYLFFFKPLPTPYIKRTHWSITRDSIDSVCRCYAIIERQVDTISPSGTIFGMNIVCDTLGGDDSLKILAAHKIARIAFRGSRRDSIHLDRISVIFRMREHYFGYAWIYTISPAALAAKKGERYNFRTAYTQ